MEIREHFCENCEENHIFYTMGKAELEIVTSLITRAVTETVFNTQMLCSAEDTYEKFEL